MRQETNTPQMSRRRGPLVRNHACQYKLSEFDAQQDLHLFGVFLAERV